MDVNVSNNSGRSGDFGEDGRREDLLSWKSILKETPAILHPFVGPLSRSA
jgi:hypothetical protein